jgi:putative phage-type endonuclease
LVKTTGLSHEDWLRYRKLGIGGSDAGAICGLNPYSTTISVFMDKTTDNTDNFDNESMRQGRDLEDYVAQRFTEATGLKVRRTNAIYYHEDYPHLLANVDRMIVGQNVGLECKTTNILNADKWKNGDVPAHYQLQCHHYMAVTGATAWYIAVIILGKEFKYVRIDRDEEIIKNLITIESKFWYNHVLTGVMPNPDGSKAADVIINQYFRNAKHEIITLHGFTDKIQRRFELSELIDKLEREKKQLDQEVKLAMADAEAAYCGNYEINWKNVSIPKLDVERIKEELPDIYRSYLKETECRRFTIKTIQQKEVA